MGGVLLLLAEALHEAGYLLGVGSVARGGRGREGGREREEGREKGERGRKRERGERGREGMEEGERRERANGTNVVCSASLFTPIKCCIHVYMYTHTIYNAHVQNV